ncbi:uncharacterized protein M6B38_182315 [Iris pallida]|uniref:Secreted protein n=1 Tax=Iris pallida TaxID=29817 RepID=A0AAX6EMG9_IRIPA|nr:uncharacterized protein M6B38_182315 [Iris pallida]
MTPSRATSKPSATRPSLVPTSLLLRPVTVLSAWWADMDGDNGSKRRNHSEPERSQQRDPVPLASLST